MGGEIKTMTTSSANPRFADRRTSRRGPRCVLSGLFYREFTKSNDFPEGQFTQLGLVHIHLLALGFIVLLIVLVLEMVFALSQSRKLFGWFSGSTMLELFSLLR